MSQRGLHCRNGGAGDRLVFAISARVFRVEIERVYAFPFALLSLDRRLGLVVLEREAGQLASDELARLVLGRYGLVLVHVVNAQNVVELEQEQLVGLRQVAMKCVRVAYQASLELINEALNATLVCLLSSEFGLI